VVRLSAFDLDRTLGFVLETERLPDDGVPFGRAYLDLLKMLIPCEIASFTDWDRASRRWIAQANCSADSVTPEGWDLAVRPHDLTVMAAVTPMAPNRSPDRAGSASRLSDFLGLRQRRSAAVRDDWYFGLGVRDDLSIWLGASTVRTATLMLWSTERDFSERDRNILDVLRPHFVGTYRNARIRRRLRAMLAVDGGPTRLAPGLAHDATSLPGTRLTDREWEVMRCLRMGLTNEECAQALSISLRTVKKHLENIYEKLGVHSRTGAMARIWGGFEGS
jgi:DNA-binding CsgD family transcriptional regulator